MPRISVLQDVPDESMVKGFFVVVVTVALWNILLKQTVHITFVSVLEGQNKTFFFWDIFNNLTILLYILFFMLYFHAVYYSYVYYFFVGMFYCFLWAFYLSGLVVAEHVSRLGQQ